jgi:L-malate glycosyltransferase
MITTLHPGAPAAAGLGGTLPHVLLIVDQLPKALGGGERIVLKLASLLPQYGYRASILTFNAHPETTALQSPPCPIYLLPIQRTYDLRAFQAAVDLRRFLREQHVAVVQTFFESSDIWAGLVTKISSDAKLIWSRRDMGILRTSKHHVAYRLMSRLPDAVFAVSDLVRQHCIDVDGIDPSRVLTVYNGLDLAAWSAPSATTKPEDRVLITTAGHIRHVKGHDIFVKAAASVVREFPEAHFTIAGDVLEPEYFAELQALVAELGLNRNFHFAGGISNLPEYLAVADIFVLPSRSEGFSNAIVEAMAASLPVVATDVGGNAEAVKHGITGFIVPPEDPESLAAAIKRLISDRATAAAMGIAGRDLTAQQFTLDAMMNRTTGTYRRLLAR